MPRQNYVSVQSHSRLAYSDWAVGWKILGQIPAGVRDLSLVCNVQTSTGTHPDYYSKGTRGLSLEVERPEREADLLPP